VVSIIKVLGVKHKFIHFLNKNTMYWKTWLKTICPKDWTIDEIYSFLISSNVVDVTKEMISNEIQ